MAAQVVVEITPDTRDIDRTEAVTQSDYALPRQVGIACTDVEVIWNIPVALGTECRAPFQADDRIP